jgi:hypothetical protein
MESSVRNVLDPIPHEARTVIEDELAQRDPDLLQTLRNTQEPSTKQSDAVVSALFEALSEHFGVGHIPDEHGIAIDNAIGA